MKKKNTILCTAVSLIAIFILVSLTSCKQSVETNYHEADVPKYSLPGLLVSPEYGEIKSVNAWEKNRRNEILDLFKSEIYGPFPEGIFKLEFEPKQELRNFLDSTAILKETLCKISSETHELEFRILTVLPLSEDPVPVFLGLNFMGNHSLDSCQKISLVPTWKLDWETKIAHRIESSEEDRGSRINRWPLSTIVNRGYGVSTVYYGELDPDYDDGFINGLHPLFAEAGITEDHGKPGSISIWAKGMSLVLEYLLTDTLVDHERIIAIGHSRLGKTALWAGANDGRFAAVISNNSGCGGAALSMRNFGETVERINTSFPHWFNDKFKTYNKQTGTLPVDQHMLLALMAPRPIYVASATEDQWADPRGEFLALKEASAVYDLYGFDQAFPEAQPQPNQSYQGINGYHIRKGPHDLTEADWIMYMDWADTWL